MIMAVSRFRSMITLSVAPEEREFGFYFFCLFISKMLLEVPQ